MGSGPELLTEATVLKQEAVQISRKVVETFPNDPVTYALLGSAYYNIGQAEEAARQLKRCLELRPNQIEAYEILARIAYEKGKPEECVQLNQEALRRGATGADVLGRLGRALMDLGRLGESVGILEQATRQMRPGSESFYLLGQAQLQSANYLRAKESFQRAIELLPDHTQAHFGLFTACLRLGQTEEAGRYRETFQKLEAADRRMLSNRSSQEDSLTGLPLVRRSVARTLFGAAQIYRVHEEIDKAVVLFRRSALLDGDNLSYRAALEGVLLQGGVPKDGLNVFAELTREQPENLLNHLFVARFQGRLEQIDGAEESYRTVQRLAPEMVEGYRGLAELYVRSNRKPAEAVELARKAVELEPAAPNYYLLAVARLRQKDRAGALEAVKQALARKPMDATYKELLQHLERGP